MARRRLEEFELGRVLGVGTAGTIYEAFDKVVGAKVALKILLPTVSADKIVLARFEREMVILEKLSHPNIVRYHGGGRSGEQLFFAIELLNGGTLKDELARGGAFTWVEAATCGAQICSALQHAHNHGIIHRDLKPSNLMFDDDGNLKLLDFGIARDTHEADITSKGLTVGSYAYMSPEQITGDSTITGQADLYSFGAVLYEMLTNRPPFAGDNFAQIFKQHLTQQPVPIRHFAPRCPEAMERITLQCLSKKPEQRPFNARTVQGTLLSLLDEELKSDTSQDVAAAKAIDLGRAVLVQRLRDRSREVSWVALGGVGLAACVFAWAAWYFGA
ncbi:MAG: serine/threonine protein kinase [Planctomycetaceae bacterium]|nr:serine/threonine protein kinase [Planctomycetales bacterium]MCB9924762.1 serine/threonine protein kinase [Planctomycetaceae bacterium]